MRRSISRRQVKSTDQINGSDPKAEEISMALAARGRTALLGLNELSCLFRQQLVLMGPKPLVGAIMVCSLGFVLAGSVVPQTRKHHILFLLRHGQNRGELHRCCSHGLQCVLVSFAPMRGLWR